MLLRTTTMGLIALLLAACGAPPAERYTAMEREARVFAGSATGFLQSTNRITGCPGAARERPRIDVSVTGEIAHVNGDPYMYQVASTRKREQC